MTQFASIHMATKKRSNKAAGPKPAAQLFIVGAANAQGGPTPNQVLNFVINSVALCSGYSASSISKSWVLGDPITDASGDKHPGAGLSQHGIDICLNPKLNQLIAHFGSTNTVAAGAYSPTSTVSDVANDVGQRIP